MAGLHDALHRKPVIFTILATLTVLAGTIVTMLYPMLRPEMHPKLENLNPYTALQLAGRDIYQREGCFYCHTQTVRPLKTEVLRYGEYSKAGEFAYDHPFLWGSKRTGPDLARIGGKYPDAWHYRHMENPRLFFKESNMPSYAFLKDRRLNPLEVERHMKALGFPYTKEEIEALKDKTEMDAIVAYLQVIGTAVKKKEMVEAKFVEEKNPLAGKIEAIKRGKELYKKNCEICHGEDGKGGIGPSLRDNVWLNRQGDISDGRIFSIIFDGTEAGMPAYGTQMDRESIWSLVSYIRDIQVKK
ncbi:MAG: cbb3-type cytochrome c oxidase subunit II [Thermodesulfovibrionales bacterium]|nr:cbb3-type cytochrome c oxidase subunit II [Thermodesulfovibrionales bacterium]